MSIYQHVIKWTFFFAEFYGFVRPKHKREFDALCVSLTGESCGYQPEHALASKQLLHIHAHGRHHCLSSAFFFSPFPPSQVLQSAGSMVKYAIMQVEFMSTYYFHILCAFIFTIGSTVFNFWKSEKWIIELTSLKVCKFWLSCQTEMPVIPWLRITSYFGWYHL